MDGAGVVSRRLHKPVMLLSLAWLLALIVRMVCVVWDVPLVLGSRVEIATPLNSIKRLAEGYWLKQIGTSPYEGSVYHGSPLLLAFLGPLVVNRAGGRNQFAFSIICICADFMAAFFILRVGNRMQAAQLKQFFQISLDKPSLISQSMELQLGDIAAVLYLWNPFTIVSCVGGCTSAIENAMVILALYGVVSGNTPLGTFGWVMATHFSLYPAILLIPITLSLAVGIDHPPKKVLEATNVQSQKLEGTSKGAEECERCPVQEESPYRFKTQMLKDVIIWSVIWWTYIITLSLVSLGNVKELLRMFSETYGFILSVEDLSPNLGIFWYFFTEVFDFFRPFFLLVFHANVVFMIVPLTIRLHHRPMFLAFIFCIISSMLKSYPSVADLALYIGLVPLFINELSGMRFTFFLLNGYVGVALLSPVMYNLWIWKGTGNANFYFAMALTYSCIQLIMVVETVSTLLLFDRHLAKLKGHALSQKAI